MRTFWVRSICIMAIPTLSGCAMGNRYLAPTKGDIAYVDIVTFRTVLIYDEPDDTNYMLGTVGEDGCASVSGLKSIKLDSLDKKGKIVFPANSELALRASRLAGGEMCGSTVAANFEKGINYQWFFWKDAENCGINVRKENPDGSREPIKLKSMSEGVTEHCKAG